MSHCNKHNKVLIHGYEEHIKLHECFNCSLLGGYKVRALGMSKSSGNSFFPVAFSAIHDSIGTAGYSLCIICSFRTPKLNRELLPRELNVSSNKQPRVEQ